MANRCCPFLRTAGSEIVRATRPGFRHRSSIRKRRKMPDLRSKGPGGLNILTALELSETIAAGQTTSVAIVQDCLKRIEARDSDIRAWAHVDPDSVLRQARACDEQARRSPLHGIPVG